MTAPALQLWLGEPSAHEQTIASLPKAKQAELRWAMSRLESGFGAVSEAPGDADLLARETATMVLTTRKLVRELLPLASDEASASDGLARFFDEAERILRKRFRDPAAAGALRWIQDNLVQPQLHWMTSGTVGELASTFAEPTDEAITAFAATPAGALWRATTLIGAIAYAARQHPPSPRLPEITWTAFEEATRAADRFGFAPAAAPCSERSKHVLDAAKWVRETLRPEDVRVLDAARVRTLR